jgi:hypothetical protein
MRCSEHCDTFHHGPLHPFGDAGVVADSLDRHPECDGKMPFCCQQELHTQGFLAVTMSKIPEDSDWASMEAMQWVILYLSITDDGCYREHLAQHS